MNRDALKSYMESKGITEVQMAAKLKVTQPHINLIKNGKATPSLRLAARISKLTGIPMVNLIPEDRKSA